MDPPPQKKKKMCLGAEQKKHNEKPVGGQVLETEQPDMVSRLERMHPVSGMSVICIVLWRDLLNKIHSRVSFLLV